METERQSHCSQKPQVGPWRHQQKGLIFRKPVKITSKIISNYSNLTDELLTYELSALSISMVTNTERAIVIGCGSWNTWQSIPANSASPPKHCK